MTFEWQYQVRFDLDDSAAAESMRREQHHPALAPLLEVLAKYRAAISTILRAAALGSAKG